MKHHRHRLHSVIAWAALGVIFSTGVHALEPDGGTTQLQARIAGKVLGTTDASALIARPLAHRHAMVQSLLSSPLSLDAAVRIALLNNPDLLALLGREGGHIADMPPPDAQTLNRVQASITLLSAQVNKAWVQAVASAQAVTLLQEAAETAHTSDTLKRRMVQAGNTSALAHAQSQLRLSETAIALARARSEAFAARENLGLLLGLWADTPAWPLPATLPPLPERLTDMPDMEARAIAARLDLQQAQAQWNTQRANPSSAGSERLWDTMGDAAQLRAQALRLRSQARSAYFNYRSSWDIAHHMQTHTMPLHQVVHDELILRYNGMLTSVFDVLAQRQSQTLAAHSALMAQRDFWLADADIRALLAGVPLEALPSNPRADAPGNAATAAAH
jgi:outer membrane protein, multidrug efflux system